MGVERFYNYFREEELRGLIAQTDYRIASYHREGGDAKNKWRVFVHQMKKFLNPSKGGVFVFIKLDFN